MKTLTKSMVFIDGGFFNHILRDVFHDPSIDYAKFCDNICQDYRLRTYYYDCLPYQSNPSTQDESRRYSEKSNFFNKLENLPRFEVKKGRLQKINTSSGPKFQQKLVDVLLSVDLVKISGANQIESAIIITGDSDFIPAIMAAKDAGVMVQLWYHEGPRGHSTHFDLISKVDERYKITQDLIDRSLL